MLCCRALLDKDRGGDDGFEAALETEMDMYVLYDFGGVARS